MNFPGLLIEYLVVGSTALMWLLPLVGISITSTESVSVGKAAALAPALYVLGMLVDFGAFLLVSYVPTKKLSLKALVRARVYARHPDKAKNLPPPTTGSGRHTTITLLIQSKTPSLYEELELRSSRDRIARSTVINLLLLAAVLNWCNSTPNFLYPALCALASLMALGMWLAYESSTSEFELYAFNASLERDANAPS